MQQFDEIKKLLGESGTYYLIAVGMDSNYTYLNKRYAETFEPIHGNLLGKHYSTTVHPEDRNICATVSEMAFTYTDRTFPATIRKHDGMGSFIITRWDYKAMLDENGFPAGIFCFGHDITELLEVSGELEKIKYGHSHLVRRHVANLAGLGKILQQIEEPSDIRDIVKLMVQSATELDAVIRKM